MDQKKIASNRVPSTAIIMVLAFIGMFALTYESQSAPGILDDDIYTDNRAPSQMSSGHDIKSVVKGILSDHDRAAKYPAIEIRHPYNGAVFPPDIASPIIRWEDEKSEAWLVMVEFTGLPLGIYVLSEKKEWIPEKPVWEVIKTNSVGRPATITILGFNGRRPHNVTAKSSIDISTSRDRIEHSLIYTQAPLPFVFARDNPERMRFRIGSFSDYKAPEIILNNQPHCGNCHFLHRFRQGRKVKSFGKFPKVSPDEQYEVSSVNVRSLVAILEDAGLTEFVYHAAAIIGYYSETDTEFHPLPGADDPDFVHTNPAWSPDGKYVVFARAPVNKKLLAEIKEPTEIEVEKGTRIRDLNERYPAQYSIYRVPFNNGRGGAPEPIKGASHNGVSNALPRYSPDGKWIVFTQCEYGFVLQPTSTLWIVPAEGGVARKMRCNRALYNSYHNWSPNSRWMVFTSKVNTMYTELFLTHVDENGNDSPPVLLSRFNSAGYAQIVPEFITVREIRGTSK